MIGAQAHSKENGEISRFLCTLGHQQIVNSKSVWRGLRRQLKRRNEHCKKNYLRNKFISCFSRVKLFEDAETESFEHRSFFWQHFSIKVGKQSANCYIYALATSPCYHACADNQVSPWNGVNAFQSFLRRRLQFFMCLIKDRSKAARTLLKRILSIEIA